MILFLYFYGHVNKLSGSSLFLYMKSCILTCINVLKNKKFFVQKYKSYSVEKLLVYERNKYNHYKYN